MRLAGSGSTTQPRCNPEQRIRRSFPRRPYRALCAGISVASVFVHLLPEVETARTVLVRSTADWSASFPPHLVSLTSLAGFMLFLRSWPLCRLVPSSLRSDLQPRERRRARLLLHVGIFAIYAGMVTYLRINGLEDGETPILVFAIAKGTHFRIVDHRLRPEYGASYARTRRFVLAGASIAGWGGARCGGGAVEAADDPAIGLAFRRHHRHQPDRGASARQRGPLQPRDSIKRRQLTDA
jgi:hypothetical protein